MKNCDFHKKKHFLPKSYLKMENFIIINKKNSKNSYNDNKQKQHRHLLIGNDTISNTNAPNFIANQCYTLTYCMRSRRIQMFFDDFDRVIIQHHVLFFFFLNFNFNFK